MIFAFLFLGYKIFIFHGGKDNTSMSSKILESNIFANNLLNLPLDFLESITVFVCNQAYTFYYPLSQKYGLLLLDNN